MSDEMPSVLGASLLDSVVQWLSWENALVCWSWTSCMGHRFYLKEKLADKLWLFILECLVDIFLTLNGVSLSPLPVITSKLSGENETFQKLVFVKELFDEISGKMNGIWFFDTVWNVSIWKFFIIQQRNISQIVSK